MDPVSDDRVFFARDFKTDETGTATTFLANTLVPWDPIHFGFSGF